MLPVLNTGSIAHDTNIVVTNSNGQTKGEIQMPSWVYFKVFRESALPDRSWATFPFIPLGASMTNSLANGSLPVPAASATCSLAHCRWLHDPSICNGPPISSVKVVNQFLEFRVPTQFLCGQTFQAIHSRGGKL